MALIKCPECGRDVSDTIENCIHCGYALGKVKETSSLVAETDKEATDNKYTPSATEKEAAEETGNGCLKFLLCLLGVVVLSTVIFACLAAISKCPYCTDGFIGPCEDCTDGTVVCEKCEGNMTVECNNCNDEFKAKCTDCDGSGDGERYTQKCYTCGGNGSLQFDCDNCNGKGWVYARLTPTQCMRCNGSGKGEVKDCPLCKNGIATKYKDCESCEGKGYGKEDCTKCNKTKKVECENCLGTGIVACAKCNGNGNIACTYCNNN